MIFKEIVEYFLTFGHVILRISNDINDTSKQLIFLYLFVFLNFSFTLFLFNHEVDLIINQILLEVRYQSFLALGQFQICHHLKDPKFFNNMTNIKLFLDLSLTHLEHFPSHITPESFAEASAQCLSQFPSHECFPCCVVKGLTIGDFIGDIYTQIWFNWNIFICYYL